MKPIIFLLLVVVPIFVGCSRDPELDSAGHLSRALTLYDQGDLRAAKIEAKNALSTNPQNATARLLLGQIYTDLGEYFGAEKELRVAHKLGVPDESILPLLANAFLQSEEYDKVLNIKLPDTLSTVTRTEILSTQSVALLRLGMLDDAEEKLQEALRFNPNAAMPLAISAMVSLSRGDRAAARQHVLDALESDSSFAPALSTLGDLESLESRPEKAMQAYEQAVSARPGGIEDRWKLIVTLISMNKAERAKIEAANLRELAPNSPERFFAEGLLSFFAKDNEAALESFDEAIRRDTSGRLPTALLYAAVTSLAAHRIEMAETYANRYRTRVPGDLSGIRVTALILSKRQKYDQLIRFLRPVIDSGKADHFTVNLMASALIQSGQTREGIQLLESLVSTNEASARSAAQLGLSLVTIGDADEGLKHLQAAIELDPEFDQAALILALGYLKKGETQNALAEANRYKERHADSHLAYLMLGFVHTRAGDIDDAAQAFRKVDSLDPGNPAANHELALIAAHAEDFDRAKGRYARILQVKPDDLQALIGLAKIAKHQNDGAAAKIYLRKAIDTYPQALQPRILLAKQLIAEGKFDEAVQSLDEFRASGSKNPIFLKTLAVAQTAAGSHELAHLTYQRLVSALPDSHEAHYLLAKSFSELDRPEKVKEHLERALELKPNYTLAVSAYVQLSVRAGNLDDAKRRLSNLDSTLPAYEDLLILIADSAQIRGKEAKALQLLQAQMNQSPSEKLSLALIRNSLRSGNTRSAAEIAQDWLQSHPDSIAVRRSAAELAQTSGNKGLAIEHYRAILERDPSNVAALNNVSELLRDTSAREAYRYATEAKQLAPKNPAVLDTFAAAALAVGKHEEAELAIEEALRLAPKHPQLIERRNTILKTTKETNQ